MAGVPNRSGGHNRVSIEEHHLRGTLRPARHLRPTPPAPPPLSPADRRCALAGLRGPARRIVLRLLEGCQGFDPSSLVTLRLYGLSCARLAALQDCAPVDVRAVHRELRANLALRKSLGLEHPR